MKPAGQSGFLTEITREPDELQALIEFALMPQNFEGGVRASIINADDFIAEIQLSQNRIKPAEQASDITGFVMEGEDDGKVCHRKKGLGV